MSSLGMSCNFHNEPHALPGLIENAKAFFDDIVFISSPPAGVEHHEESCQIIRDAGCRLALASVDRGFGVLRTRCIRESRADWVMIMDADERFINPCPEMSCSGTEGYPQFKEPKLNVSINGVFNQGERIRHFIDRMGGDCDAIRLSRRHWFNNPDDGSEMKPCQNWHLIPDHQLRLVKNSPFIFYNPDERMHEKILDSRTWAEPRWHHCDGVYYDHFHCHFKALDQQKNKRDMETYQQLDQAGTKDMWLNAQEGAKS